MLKRKKDGNIGQFIPILITLLTVFILFSLQLGWTKDFDKKDRIDMIARSYMLRMESLGYLIPEDEDNLIEELESVGLENISLIGTTIEKVEFANDIVLKIQGTISINNYSLDGLWNFNQQDREIPIDITKKSTSKN